MIHIEPVPKEINLKLKKQYSGGIFGESPSFVQVGKNKWFFPERYRDYADNYKNFKIRPGDVWVTGYPRSGTSVTADICWMLTHDIDFDTAKKTAFNERSKLFELNTLFGSDSKLITQEKNREAFRNLFQTLEEEQGRRVIKTHLPYELLPDNLFTSGAKVVYIVRNIKDVMVSFYNLQKTPTRENFQGDFLDFWTNLENDHLTFAPYWKHVEQGIDPTKSNKMVIFYEKDIQDMRNCIRKLAEFINVQISNKQLDDLTEFFNFKNYKKATEGKNFFNDNFEHVRKGEAGGWKKEFPLNLQERADRWKENNLKNMRYQEYIDYFS